MERNELFIMLLLLCLLQDYLFGDMESAIQYIYIYIYISKNSAKFFLKLSAFGFRLHQSFKTQ